MSVLVFTWTPKIKYCVLRCVVIHEAVSQFVDTEQNLFGTWSKAAALKHVRPLENY